ncbi:MAG: response regulator transcription factor [Cyanobacteria bacterium P01_A01_bin.84]
MRVVITESDSLTLLGLKWVIENQPDMEVVASSTTAKDGIEAIKDGADIAIIDSNLQDINGLQIVDIVQEIGCRVVVSTRNCDQDILSAAMQHNVDCLYLKTSNPSLLPQAIRCAFHKDSWIDPEISKNLMNYWATNLDNSNRKKYRKGRSNYDPLTKTEIEILKLIACGYSYEEMANKTYITLATVRCHANSIYSKLGVNNRVRAIIKGIKLKYLDINDLKDTEEAINSQAVAI